MNKRNITEEQNFDISMIVTSLVLMISLFGTVLI
ncbi:hypothetical protein IMSAG049_00194 [Clostridiales bacterium]|nr:hypothetical protein IMSAG049_00194 [Clostridiales bacterium]